MTNQRINNTEIWSKRKLLYQTPADLFIGFFLKKQTCLQSSLGEEFVKEAIKKQCGVDVSIRRLRYRDSKKPLPVAVVTCAAHEGLAALFKADITIAKKKVRVVPYRSKRNIPVRYYRCQEYGHVARSCENEERCEKCSESHKGECKGKTKCYNCKGSHGAGVRDCQVYVNLFERLTSRQ